MNKIRQLTLLSMFTTIALTIFVLESAIPIPIPIPGIKLGLANIVTLILILYWGFKEALIVLVMRIILGSIFAGQMMTFFYSLVGGIFCLSAMYLTNRILKQKTIWFTSIIGAICHNIGQILVALAILQSAYVLYYLPFLLVSGILTGFFTGLGAGFLSKRFPALKKLYTL